MQIVEVNNESGLLIIQRLAKEIWPGVYEDLLGPAQVQYMLEMMYSLDVLRMECKEEVKFLLVVEEGDPVGFASYGPAEERCFKLHKIYLHEKVRGKGYGKALIEEIKRRVAAAGGKTLKLNVNKYNSAAVAAYSKCGMKQLYSEKNAIGNGYYMDDFVMGCPIGE